MRTVGEILKQARVDKYYSLDEVEKATKIRKELLIALEADDFSKLPPSTFVQGFIKNYAKFLNLNSEKLLAIYRREYADEAHQPYVMDAFAHPPKENKLKITPGRVLGLAVALIIIAFFAYLWYQYQGFVGLPKLTLTSPVDQYTTSQPAVTVEGEADPEVKVQINSQDIPTDRSGKFKEEVNLSSEVNKITITAISRFGQKVSLERTVYLKKL